jgi:hypothetical protein
MPYIRRNLNQFRKVYPGIRKEPVYENIQRVEIGRIVFSNSNSESFKFSNSYDSPPIVTFSAVGANANVNLYCESVTTKRATIVSSANFTGEAHIHVMENV